MLRFIDVIHQDASIAVEAMLLNVVNPMLMYLVIDVESHSINEEVTPIAVQRFTLSLMFDGRVVLAIDVQDHSAVEDVVKSQKWSLDVADVEPGWEADVVADEQDVFVAMDVDRLVGSCRKGNLGVVWLWRYVVCEVSRCNRRNSGFPSDEVTLEVDLEDVRDSAGCRRSRDDVLRCLVVVLLRSRTCC